MNPVDAALAKKKKVTLSVDTAECKYCGKLYHTGKKLTEHINQEHPGEQTIYACFSAEYKLEDHRLAEHKISSLGTSVEASDQGDQPPELPGPGDVGVPQQEPTREKGNQGDQPLEPPAPLNKPSSKEPKVLAGSKDPQVEVYEVKGSEVQTGEYDRECGACNHFFSSNIYRCSHVTRYHKALLRRCKMCMRLFMFPWDFDRHLDSLHSKCKMCQQYLANEEMLLDHMDLEHPTVTPELVVTQDQVTEGPATLEADRQDRQVKCKYKRNKCPQCEKHFVKQADCDNHIRDVHKFVCSISGCSVFKYNEIELHEHLRYDHRSKMVFRCNKCVKVFPH